jgi:hypothetical protein
MAGIIGYKSITWLENQANLQLIFPKKRELIYHLLEKLSCYQLADAAAIDARPRDFPEPTCVMASGVIS